MAGKRKLIIIIALVLLAAAIYQVFLKKEKPAFTLAQISLGNIVQEVSETGQVKKGEKINLSFKSSGKIEKIYVKAGDKVESGQNLAKLDTQELEIQLAQAQAALSVIEAKKRDAQVSLDSARQDLRDTINTANEKIEKEYENALSALDDAYLKIYDSFNFIGLLRLTYFGRGDTESVAVSENKDAIERVLNQAKFYIQKAKDSQLKEDIDKALSKAKEALSETKTALEDIRNIIEKGGYRDIVSISDRNTLDSHRLNINTAHSNIAASQADISLAKVANTAEVNTSQSQVSNLESQLKEEQNGLYQAQIKQAQAQVQLLENQIRDSYLKSLTRGQITEINKEAGEVVQPTFQDAVVSLLPESPFEVEVNVYEEDVVKVNVGNPVDISLIAFPDKVFKGKVALVDPAEKVVEGVVYYEVTVIFEEEVPKDLKPGMTVDVTIKTAEKQNVLVVPEGAVQKKDGKKTVQVLKDKKIQEREVEIGLEGNDGALEVISGVLEGEKVIVR